MRIFAYNDLDGVQKVTEDYIKMVYYPYWSGKMSEKGLDTDINFENCLDEWIAIHWAWEVDKS